MDGVGGRESRARQFRASAVTGQGVRGQARPVAWAPAHEVSGCPALPGTAWGRMGWGDPALWGNPASRGGWWVRVRTA